MIFISPGKEDIMKIQYDKLKNNWLLLIILGLASCLRLIALGTHPEGTYTDEAYGAYIAYGLLTEGIDDRGCHFPVYFIAWGSGMNALYPYLGVLFFKLFGVSLLAYRLPQALFGILSIFAFYIIVRELLGQKAGLFFAFVLTVNPWHIMMCRFGLESNLAPSIFLLGLMFLVLGLRRKSTWLIPAAIFFGLTLYCYAVTWLILPIFFVFSLLLCHKSIPRSKSTLAFVVILFLLALPLFIFLAVNYGLLPEIRTPFITIPKLTGFRSDELSPAYIADGLLDLLRIVVFEQGDGNEILSGISTGSYYYFTTPFMVFGILYHIYTLICNYRPGANDLTSLFLAWLVGAGMISAANHYLTMIHINMIHIPIIFYGAYGFYNLSRKMKSKFFLGCGTAFYALSLCFFLNAYAKTEFSLFFGDKPYEALLAAKDLAPENGSITFFGTTIYKYPNLLWREKSDINDYLQNAVYNDNPLFAELLHYGNYHFIYDDINLINNTLTDVYILSANRMDEFRMLGFQVIQVNDSYAVATPPMP